ncbi:hypothetical protein [Polaribacter sp. SA4-12]|uniref:hypothetical protein n=1 Tax=Polaribacter sp. SA4-12 TaxID=1312072 RepID=UPI000B3C2347|nr:hypothetical protein [Polaribacter sp. SA4-12]ARV13704.1 hypothetical protein BTO07_00475 [Polaribacter sp. SA4-12]
MKKNNVIFLNDNKLIEEESYLWRYLDLHKFISFINEKSICFTRLDKFEDAKEGATPNHLLKNFLFDNHQKELEKTITTSIDISVNGRDRNRIDKEIEQIQRFNFASCWFIGSEKSESVAMWNIYSKPNDVAIKIKYSDFKENLSKYGFLGSNIEMNIVCKPIEYIDFQSPNSLISSNMEDSVFMKDNSFNHEKEFRLVIKEEYREIDKLIFDDNICKKSQEKTYNERENYPNIILELLNFNKYNFEVVHHPKSQKWAKDNIEKFLKVNFKISNSNLELN